MGILLISTQERLLNKVIKQEFEKTYDNDLINDMVSEFINP